MFFTLPKSNENVMSVKKHKDVSVDEMVVNAMQLSIFCYSCKYIYIYIYIYIREMLRFKITRQQM